jgi:hypothetical protein
MNRVSPTIDESELRRICGILEEIADRFDLSETENQAIETAALALMAANLTNALKSSYAKLSAAHNGNIPDSVKRDMLAHGIDIESLESDDDV